jgi:multiple sugar transport system ATP-binding protein
MGRAVVRDPRAFLMDEPLSNLDAKLRVQMRTEVSRIQQTLGTTTIYVTHDQTEAMTLGDRVAVMRSGIVQQVGTPMELYTRPANLFVAGFIGSPAMNFMPARVDGDSVRLPLGRVKLPQRLREQVGRIDSNKSLIAGIRPESFAEAGSAGTTADAGCTFTARIEVLEAMGSEFYVHFTATTDQSIDSKELRELAEDSGAGDVPTSGEQGRIVARLEPNAHVRQGEDAELWLDASALHLFDPEDGRSLTSSADGPSAAEGQGPGGRDPNAGSDAAV